MKKFSKLVREKFFGLKSANVSFLTSFLVVLIIVIFFIILFISYTVNKGYHAVRTSLNRFIVCEQSAETIKTSANQLTELARMFVVNHDEQFVLAYLNEIENNNSQKKALEDLKAICSDKDLALERLNIAIIQAESITQMELYNMRLCYEILGKSEAEIPSRLREIEIKESDKNLSKEELQSTAIKNLFGHGFLIYKVRIQENCLITVQAISNEVKNELDENAENLGQNLDRLRILILMLLIINALSSIGLKEFKTVTRSYTRIYELGEQKTKILLKNAEYDALTGILNRRAYEQICKTSTEQKMNIALLLIDLDNFKSINDTYGHAGGDTALKALASILKDTFRNNDYVARIGGDEFAVILTDFKTEGFKIISEKIKYINERLSELDGLKNISISVGMAYSPVGYSETLYKHADKALYAVKENGKGASRIYDSSLE